jgi:hypothetical protein
MDFADAEKWVADAGTLLITLVTTNALTFITLLTVLIAIWQLMDTNKIARGQFWLMLRDVMSQYDDIHSNFRPGGKWHASSTQPDTIGEWARTELYMGLLEYCNELIKGRLLDKGHFEDWYKYRIDNLLSNPRVVTYKLQKNASGWKKFWDLCERLKVTIPPATETLPPFSRDDHSENIPPVADLRTEFEEFRTETHENFVSLRNEIRDIRQRLKALEEAAHNSAGLTK